MAIEVSFLPTPEYDDLEICGCSLNLYSRDLDETKNFYSKYLKFNIISEHPTDGLIKLGLLSTEINFKKVPKKNFSGNLSGYFEIELQNGIQQYYNLLQKEIEVSEYYYEMDEGFEYFTLTDNNGYEIRFIKYFNRHNLLVEAMISH